MIEKIKEKRMSQIGKIMNVRMIAEIAIGSIVAIKGLGFIALPVVTWSYSAEDVGRIAMLRCFPR